MSRFASRSSYDSWTVILGSLAIFVTIAASFLIGARMGWLGLPRTPSSERVQQPISAETSAAGRSGAETGDLAPPAKRSSTAKSCVGTAAPGCPAERGSAPAADELVVYEKGKVVFRMKPAPTRPASDAVVQASSLTKLAPLPLVWLSPEQAETLLLSHAQPQFPHEALAAHRAGNVVLEVEVAEDGAVSQIRTLSGDPLLAEAATEAVRTWRYEPYRPHDMPTQFQTDVTVSFTLPN